LLRRTSVRACALVASGLFAVACSTPARGKPTSARTFEQLVEPTVLLFPAGDANRRVRIDAKTHESTRNAGTADGLIAVIDWSIPQVFTSTLVPELPGWFEKLGAYAPRLGRYYFYSSFGGFVFSLDRQGALGTRVPVGRMPANISSFVTEQGYLLIGHSLLEERGFRLSVFDTFADKLRKDDTFVPNTPGEYTYDGRTACYFNVLIDRDERGSYHEIYKLDLAQFSTSVVFRTPPTYTGSNFLVKDDRLVVGSNKFLEPSPSGEGMIDASDPRVYFIDTETLAVVDSVQLQPEQTDYYILDFFIHQGWLYLIFGQNQPSDTGATPNRKWLFRFDASSKSFRRIDSDALFGVYYQRLIVRRDELILLDPQASELRFARINLQTFQKRQQSVMRVH